MAERRQAHRREPIEVEIRGEVIEARPLPWLRRNDLGNLVIREYTEMLNSTLKTYVNPDTGAPELEMYLNDKVKDPVAILEVGYPDVKIKDEWEWPELYELIYASLDVNDLDHLRALIDPNYQTPTTTGGKNSSGMASRLGDTLRQLSSPDSESQDSPEQTSSTSPTEKSSTSSGNETEHSGTSDGGTSP